ncbi:MULTISPECIES: hypothetical protein [Argonema]|uniref:hypothetical protein n=1 Tax=Argonema TaxID=2942761 RepID=UPI002012FAFB|nr:MULTISPECIES: hypothetical protein [Argonema]MCL1465771.1 hypothetical protein [Argonema galeatum A003/A1]MCL1471182.1 hypothetical protein [Argonema antarcticum A004/B2]
MRTIKSLAWVVGLSVVAGSLTVGPVRADHAPDITGTNYWNNTAPRFGGRGGRLDPQLADRVRRFNDESQQAYNACLAAVEAAPPSAGGPRQYLRNPQEVAGEYPAACQRLNALRNDRDNLRNELERVGQISPAFKSW